ncbi:hypothetical protein DY000_02009524 [Brassica cretica]|uniref:DUF1985 domain-containing protein n=1 Tax=Brassica cretica TaxID=69181 RepID=A0ABQ7CBR7_BRACR|nr:hypothetical protein DY000_02009524 [Brassica cretica]
MVSVRLADCPDSPEEEDMRPIPDMMFAAGEEPVVEVVTVSSVMKMLYRKTVKDRDIRIIFACLALLESVLLPTRVKTKICRDHAEAIADLDEFFRFALALQLVMVEAVPALTEVVQDTCSSSESDSDDIDGNGCEMFTKKKTLNPAHARNVNKRSDVIVRSVLVEDPFRPIDGENLVWSDDEHDDKVDNM